MNTVLDLIYRLLAHPTDAMSDVTTGEKMKESSIIWGFWILLLALSSVEAGSFVTAFLASFVGTGSLLLLHSAVVDYISGLLGGRGRQEGLRRGSCARRSLMLFPFLFSYRTVWPGRHSQICCLCYYCLELFLRHSCHPCKLRVWERESLFISISPFLLCGMLITALFVIGIMTALAGISELQDVEGIINSF